MKQIALILLGLILYCPLAASEDGGTRSPFSLGAGSRDLALSGAAGARCQPTAAMYWNASRLATAQQYSLTAFRTRLFDDDASYQYFGLAVPTLDYGTFGLGVFYLGVSGIEGRDGSNLLLDSFDDSRTAVYLSYARHISGYAVGLTIYMEHHKLADYSASSSPGVNLALSRRFDFTAKRLSFIEAYVNARNVVKAGYKLVDETAEYPIGFEAGLSIGFKTLTQLNQRATLSLNIEKYDYVDPRLTAGLEYSINDMLHLRGGIRQSNPSAGAGIEYKGFSFDYALVERDMGSLHTFTLSSMFGSTIASRRKQRAQSREVEFQALMNQRMNNRNESLIQQLVDDGRNLLNSGNLSEAKTNFDRALFLARSSGQDTLQIAGLADETNARLDEILRLKRYNTYVDSATAAFDEGDYLSTKYFAGLALNEMSNSQEALSLRQAAADSLQNRFTREERIQRELLAADSLLSYGKISEAQLLLDQLYWEAPENTAVQMARNKAAFEKWKEQAQALYKSGKFNKAMAAVDSARNIFPGHKWCQLERSHIEKALGSLETQNVPIEVKTTVQLTPEMQKEIAALYNEGRDKFKQGQLAEAIARWERVEILAPDFQSVRNYLVNAYKFVGVDLYGQNKLDAAIETWRKAANLDPANPEIIDYINRTEAEITKLQELSYEAR